MLIRLYHGYRFVHMRVKSLPDALHAFDAVIPEEGVELLLHEFYAFQDRVGFLRVLNGYDRPVKIVDYRQEAHYQVFMREFQEFGFLLLKPLFCILKLGLAAQPFIAVLFRVPRLLAQAFKLFFCKAYVLFMGRFFRRMRLFLFFLFIACHITSSKNSLIVSAILFTTGMTFSYSMRMGPIMPREPFILSSRL